MLLPAATTFTSGLTYRTEPMWPARVQSTVQPTLLEKSDSTVLKEDSDGTYTTV